MRRLLARVTVPPDGSSCPMRMRKRVVLPMPLGPTSASRAPLATVNETPAKRSSAPKDLEREETVMSDIFMSIQFQCPRIIKQESEVFGYMFCVKDLENVEITILCYP